MFFARVLSLIALSATLAAQPAPETPAPMFSPEERKSILAFWNQPGRWRQGLPETARRDGVWQVRLTVEGSTWLWSYNRARGVAKGPPSQTPAAQNPEEQAWERWIEAKVAWDRYQAGLDAREANRALGILAPDPGMAVTFPGPAPESLIKLAGDPPAFAAARAPLRHDIDFGDGFRRSFLDYVPVRHRYAYYRFDEGVQDVGRRMRELPAAELDPVFAKARVNLSVRRVMQAVSLLEGGFESVNTYDTGFLSVGMIQFATLREGAGSLGQVLLRHKTDAPASFANDFRRFGVDVDPAGSLIVVDPGTGAELAGGPAVMQIIADKRLVAVFARAGAVSEPFRIAQLQIARDQYYPAEDVVTVTIGSKTMSARVSEIFRSEAGMATLMDRKVNTGKLDPLADVLAKLVADRGLSSLHDAGAHELELVRKMRYRTDYTLDKTLGQPKEIDDQPSRSGPRTGR